MSSIGSPSPFFFGGKKAYEVERSLRFNDDDDTYLQRTVSSTSNRKTFTISAWIKPSETDSRFFFAVTDTSGYEFFYIGINSFHRLVIFDYDYPVQNVGLVTNRLFRDPSAWYHIVVAFDTTQATNTDRVKLYVNGVQETSWYNEAYPAQNLDTFVNHTTFPVYIGKLGWGGGKYHGYMAEYNFIDGLQLTPSSFGETDVITGQWNPKKYTGSYGTNGFYLNFLDNSGTTATTLGKDSSGNGNNFTPNNFSVAAGAGNDSVQDTPTNNWSTLNPLHWNVLKGAGGTANGADFTQGNLRFVGPSSVTSPYNRQTASTIAVSSGAWYFEATIESMNNGVEIGFSQVDAIDSNGYYTGTWGFNPYDQRKLIAGTETSYGAQASANDVLGFAFDLDNNTMELFINNSSQGQVTSLGISGKTVIVSVKLAFSNIKYTFNFGQQGFAYTPPTGYKALNSANLPDPTILLPNKHFDTLLYTGNASYPRTITGLQFQPDWFWSKTRNQAYGHAVFDSVRGTGSAKGLRIDTTAGEGSNDIAPFIDLTSFNFTSGTDGGFTFAQPSNAVDVGNGNGLNFATWNWNAGDTDGKTYTVKVVSDSGNKYRFDNFGTSAVTLDLAEGGTYTFDQSDSSNATHPLRFYTAADKTGGEYTTGVTTSGTAGSSGATVTITIAASAPTLYYQCSAHAGMGGQINTNSTLGSSNFDGSRQATTKVNTTSGFSIISWTGTGSNLTIGHGLGVKPSAHITKARTGSSGCDWYVYHKEIGATHNVRLNLTDASSATSDLFNNTEPTSTVLSIGNSSCINENNGTYITYAFSEVAGYSKFGSYTGNGATDGTFVFTGFRPAWIMTKRTDSSSDWYIYDNKRPEFNVNNILISPHNARAEISYVSLDVLSNGFKLRNTGTDINASGGTFIYLAFAESPFKNARAR